MAMLTNLMVLMIAVAYGLVNGQITRNPLCPRGVTDPAVNACNCVANPPLGELCLNGGFCRSNNQVDFTCVCPDFVNQDARCAGTTLCSSDADCPAGTVDTQCVAGRCSCNPNLVAINNGGVLGCIPDTNECDLNPNACENGGTCVDLPVGSMCTCSSGFTGMTCNIDIDECAVSGFCGAGGSCINSIGGFTCICGAGRTGQTCQRSLNDDDSVLDEDSNSNSMSSSGSVDTSVDSLSR